MSGTTPVCRPGSVRKCVCRACKPYTIPRTFQKLLKFECQCKIPKGELSKKPSLEDSLSSSLNLYQEILRTKLIKQCNCIGCKPVFTRKRKRLCNCENAKLKRLPEKSILTFLGTHSSNKKKSAKNHKRHKEDGLTPKRSREEIIQSANVKLSKELSEENLLEGIDDHHDDFLIVAKKSSSFLLDKKNSSVNLEPKDSKSVLVKSPQRKNIETVQREEYSKPERRPVLTFAQEKLVVEFIKEDRNSLIELGNSVFQVFYAKVKTDSEKEDEGSTSNEAKSNRSDKENLKGKDTLKRRRSLFIFQFFTKDYREKMEQEDKKSGENPSSTTDRARYIKADNESRTIRISNRTMVEENDENLSEVDKYDPNVMYYSKYITEYDTKRIVYGLHRLLHNYILFRCEDRPISEGLISERFIEKLSEGFDLFLKNAYFYDPYYQPISFKRRYGYIELHLKIGVDDMFANRNRIFKKVFLVIFQRGCVKFILTKYKAPGKMNEKNYNYGVLLKQCEDIWVRVDFITAIVNRRHRRIRHRVIESLYDILTSNEKGFFKLVEPLEDLWICIDFDTESEKWSKTERAQFIKMMRKESDPYYKENIKHVDPLETQLEKERRVRKRKYKLESEEKENQQN